MKEAIKRDQTELGANIIVTIPLIEELTNLKMLPICLMGMTMSPDNHKTVNLHFATINDTPELEELLYNAAKQMIEKYKDKYEKAPK